MAIVEFAWQPTRWAKLTVSAGTTQADVDALFASVDTSSWTAQPTWDAGGQTVTWQQLRSPFGAPVQVPVGGVIVAERPRFHGVALPASQQADVVWYAPGDWSDSAVTYL